MADGPSDVRLKTQDHFMQRLYFDYNATAPLASGLGAILTELMGLDPKNPVSVHQDGRQARQMVEAARKTILSLFGAAQRDRLVFTSGGTESNNTILFSSWMARGERNQILLTPLEHSCIYNFAMYLQKNFGVEPVWIKVDQRGVIDLDDYAKKLDPKRVFLVSTMLANNETGFVFPVREMAKLARERGVPFHTDAVCAAGKIPISFADLGVDFLSFSSHKFGGLKGNGGIVWRDGANLSPYIMGGTHEFEKRAGTHNVFGILAAAHALKTWTDDLEQLEKHERTLRERLKTKIREIYPDVIFIEGDTQLPQTLSASFVGLSGNLLLTNLDLEGVSVSYGSACASGSLEISRVLRSLNLPVTQSSATLRLSFGPGVGEVQIDEFAARLNRVVARMRA